MKISKIEFENFRNYKGHCQIDFPTDGRVTVIYGTNGVGKTTLHQLFQWVFYGEVHFNKTASTEMYNLDFEASATKYQLFSVWGLVDFEHPNRQGVVEQFSLRREWVYRKESLESRLVQKKLRLSKKIGDDWKTISDDPANIVEQILPSGLSQYFFFDGESMIADLNQKGKDSAKSLRRALYSIFDLDIYEQAVVHIGRQDGGTSTVLGSLYSKLSDSSSDRDIVVARGNYRMYLNKTEKLENETAEYKAHIEKCRKQAQELSEQIGSKPSKKALEDRRKQAKKNVKTYEDAIKREMRAFGSTVMANYPYLFLSKVIEEAQLRIGLKVEEEKLLPGLRKELIEALLEEDFCICGNPIHEKERAVLEALKRFFPPMSYKYIYDQFKNSAVRWSATYNSEALLKHLDAIFQYRDQIAELLKEIHDIDEEQKQGDNVDALIAERAKAEDALKYWQTALNKANRDLGSAEKIKAGLKNKLDKLLESKAENQEIQEKISIMEEVGAHFYKVLHSSAKQYSESLRYTIQELLGEMLSGTRQVSMSSKFELSVKDSHGNEAKSEGQFAVVSFAYIGGIFKLLADVPELKDKEFPLILDGPFSKLDAQHRQNVINVIPSYAPQVILFSKDDINECFDSGAIDVWTIYSNEERNISHVEKGYNPEVFKVHGSHN